MTPAGHYRELAAQFLEPFLKDAPLASLDRHEMIRKLEQLLIRVATDEKLRWTKKR